MAVKKQSKQLMYLKGFARTLLPGRSDFRKRIEELKAKLTDEQLQKVEERVNYYCQSTFQPNPESALIKDLKNPKNPKAYYFDTYEYAQYFDENLPLNFVFGDVTEVPEFPSIVKSRPISEDNQNSVLLNLDKTRHFVWVKDSKKFIDKKDMMIGRGAVYQHHRHQFFEKYFEHPLANIGQVNKIGGDQNWYKPALTMKEHLDYKFILSLEGNDVATNLKWVMSSNSVAVMPKPKYETWFMEGKLIGGKHFIELKPDYSDFEDQLNHYINNPDECLEIIRNANKYCMQFYERDIEDLCALLVLRKYLNSN